MLSQTCANNQVIDYLQVQNDTNYFIEVAKKGDAPYQYCDLQVIAYASADRKNQIPIKCRWYREQGDRCYLLGNIEASHYEISPSDIGYTIVAEVIPSQLSIGKGTSWVRFGPVKLDDNSHVKLQDMLSLGCAKFLVGFFIEQQDLGKDYFIDLHMNYIKIGKDDNTVQFSYSLDQPIFDLNSVDSTSKLNLVFKYSQEYINLCDYFKIKPAEYGRIGIAFRSRFSRDLFILAFRCFAVKTGLIDNVVLKDTVFSQGMLLGDSDAEIIKKEMNLALELSSCKRELYDLIEKIKKLRIERTSFKSQIKRLEDELQQTIKQYSDLLTQQSDSPFQESNLYNSQKFQNQKQQYGNLSQSVISQGFSGAIDMSYNYTSRNKKRALIFDKNPQNKSSQSQLMLEASKLSDSIDFGSSQVLNIIKQNEFLKENANVNYNMLQQLQPEQSIQVSEDKQLNYLKNMNNDLKEKFKNSEQEVTKLKNRIDLLIKREQDLEKESNRQVVEYQQRVQELVIESTNHKLSVEKLKAELEQIKQGQYSISKSQIFGTETKQNVSEVEVNIIRQEFDELLKKYIEKEEELTNLKNQQQFASSEEILASLKIENEVLRAKVKRMEQQNYLNQSQVSDHDTEKFQEQIKLLKQRYDQDNIQHQKELIESKQYQTQLISELTIITNKLYNAQDYIKTLENEKERQKQDFEDKQEFFDKINEIQQLIQSNSKLQQENTILKNELQEQIMKNTLQQSNQQTKINENINQKIEEIFRKFDNLQNIFSKLENEVQEDYKDLINYILQEIKLISKDFEQLINYQDNSLKNDRDSLLNLNIELDEKLDTIKSEEEAKYLDIINQKQKLIENLQKLLDEEKQKQIVIEQRFNEQNNVLSQTIQSLQTIEPKYSAYIQNLENQLKDKIQKQENNQHQAAQNENELLKKIEYLTQKNNELEQIQISLSTNHKSDQQKLDKLQQLNKNLEEQHQIQIEKYKIQEHNLKQQIDQLEDQLRFTDPEELNNEIQFQKKNQI